MSSISATREPTVRMTGWDGLEVSDIADSLETESTRAIKYYKAIPQVKVCCLCDRRTPTVQNCRKNFIYKHNVHVCVDTHHICIWKLFTCYRQIYVAKQSILLSCVLRDMQCMHIFIWSTTCQLTSTNETHRQYWGLWHLPTVLELWHSPTVLGVMTLTDSTRGYDTHQQY